METKVMKNIGNWNSRFINELDALSWLLNNINTIVILKYPKRMLEYNFSKLFTIFDCDTNNLAKLPNELKVRINAEDTDNSS